MDASRTPFLIEKRIRYNNKEGNARRMFTPRSWDHDTENQTSFTIRLPVPPTDNHLHINRGRTRIATSRYKEYLLEAHERLLEQLPPGHTPDTDTYWHVHLELHLRGNHGDPPNYLKATLDALSGHCPSGGGIHTFPGFWDDDRRISRLTLIHATVGSTDPHIHITLTPEMQPCRVYKTDKE